MFVMSLSSVEWSEFVVSRGGMYMLVMCIDLWFVRCTLLICSSVFLVFM